jgi:hypothetical protein
MKNSDSTLMPQRAQALFLVQVLLDGAADHLALHGQGIDIAMACPTLRKVSPPG